MRKLKLQSGEFRRSNNVLLWKINEMDLPTVWAKVEELSRVKR
jgi:hypothetical protein